jgi:hypothetical protein
MAKALELTDETLTVAPPVPRAAQTGTLEPGRRHGKPAPKVEQMPLQVRLPRHEVKAIKIAAAESEQSLSEFMLACFHAYMKSSKQA